MPKLQRPPTLGPWRMERFADEKTGFSVLQIVSADGHSLANLIPQILDNERANGRLMAAAPDYYAAVGLMQLGCDALPGDDADSVSIPKGNWEMLLAAHAKAEGR